MLQLDRGFVRPEYPTQVLVSYYQAGQICDFIAQKWGDAALLGMIHSYAARKTTAEAIQDNLHESPDAFDKEFNTWLDAKTKTRSGISTNGSSGLKAAYQDFEKRQERRGGSEQALAVQTILSRLCGPEQRL